MRAMKKIPRELLIGVLAGAISAILVGAYDEIRYQNHRKEKIYWLDYYVKNINLTCNNDDINDQKRHSIFVGYNEFVDFVILRRGISLNSNNLI